MKKLSVLLFAVCMWASFSVPTFAAAGQHYLNEGESLVRGQWLKSNNGEYTLILQDDGNLVLYGRGKALWNTNTHGYPGSYLVVQDDGNVVIYIGRLAIWNTGTN